MARRRTPLFGVALSFCCLAPSPVAAGPNEGRGHCLGNCEACYELLEALPRGKRAAAARHLDIAHAGVEELSAFVGAPEVCQVDQLFPLSLDREFWSLASLQGGASQLGFPGAAALLRSAVAACDSLQAAAAQSLASAYRAAGACSEARSPPSCDVAAHRATIGRVAARWRAAAGAAARAPRIGASHSIAGGFVAPAGNGTLSVLAEYAARALDAFEAAGAEGRSTVEGVATKEEHNSLSGYHALATLAVDLSRLARLMVENLRLLWGIRNLAGELISVYPDIHEQMPQVAFHTEVYGRHFDVLEWLLLDLQAEEGGRTPLRMAEMGVACGPIGVHLLHRFPDMQYIGADPTIRPEVYDAYRRFGPRAKLRAVKSEELHQSLPTAEQFDLVFIDGPHTYKNVNSDIEMWEQRVRPGGILAGHDFTCAHPPLLWAVLEAKMSRGGGQVNVGLDGVWWWRVGQP